MERPVSIFLHIKRWGPVLSATLDQKEQLRFQQAVPRINFILIDTVLLRPVTITIRTSVKPVDKIVWVPAIQVMDKGLIRINRSSNSPRDHDCHSACINHNGTAYKIYSYCCCGKCSLVALFENTCPQAYGSLSHFQQSSTLMSFYSSDFLLPVDNWWKILDDSTALSPLGGLATGLPLLSQQHTSIAAACDGEKQCFHLRRAWTSTSMQDEVTNNINTFRVGREALRTCFNSVKQLQPHQARLLDSNISNKWKTDDNTSDPNGHASIVLLLLIIAGDIELNPGPESGIATHDFR